MKRKFLIAAILAATIFSLLLLAGCTAASDQPAGDSVKKDKSIDILITIEYPKKARIPGMENIKFTVEENATVLQAIELYCNVTDIPCLLETTSNTIVGINTVRNGDFNKDKIWKFTVGDSSPRTDAAEVHLKKGDTLKWTYELAEPPAEESDDEKTDDEKTED